MRGIRRSSPGPEHRSVIERNRDARRAHPVATVVILLALVAIAAFILWQSGSLPA
jgi:hypothetical protein